MLGPQVPAVICSIGLIGVLLLTMGGVRAVSCRPAATVLLVSLCCRRRCLLHRVRPARAVRRSARGRARNSRRFRPGLGQTVDVARSERRRRSGALGTMSTRSASCISLQRVIEPGPLSRYSFLDEEIRALADRGIDAYVLSPAYDADFDDGRLHVRALPADSSRERSLTLRFLARHLSAVPLGESHGPATELPQPSRRTIRRGSDRARRHLAHPQLLRMAAGVRRPARSAATGRPLVAGIRGSDVNVLPALGYGARLDPSFDRAVRRLLRTADRTVFVSEFLRRQGLALGAAPRHPT